MPHLEAVPPSRALLFVAALTPVPGVVALRPKRTVDLYGIAFDGVALALATRHRMVLRALVGMLRGVAAGPTPKRVWCDCATLLG